MSFFWNNCTGVIESAIMSRIINRDDKQGRKNLNAFGANAKNWGVVMLQKGHYN